MPDSNTFFFLWSYNNGVSTPREISGCWNNSGGLSDLCFATEFCPERSNYGAITRSGICTEIFATNALKKKGIVQQAADAACSNGHNTPE
jgi:hypothetical protein